jgi:hypothetical protein
MEKPILFSAPMVNAILGGRKTMTRRVANGALWMAPDGSLKFIDKRGIRPVLDACPYGKPGHTLWVRETFAVNCVGGESFVFYRADSYPDGDGAPWKPSIFMPRKYSRIALRITDVRVERVQDITPDDCIREGINWVEVGPDLSDIIDAFRSLWDGINAKRGYGWDANPYVWVVSFEKA